MMKVFVPISVLALVMTVGLPAGAQQKSSDDPRKEEANALFEEGNKLHNDFKEEEALDKYTKSYAIYPSPNTLLNIARAEHLLGRKLIALRHYREALRNPILSPHSAGLATKYIAELEPSFARIDLKGPTGLVVSLKREEVTLPLPEPLDIEPGTIMATGVMGGSRYSGSANAVAGRVTTITLHGPPGTEKKTFWTTEHVTGVSLGAAAVVAAGLGVGFLVMHNSKASDANGFASDSNACRDLTSEACTKYHKANDSANNAKTGSIVSFVAAGALAVGAAVLLVPWQQWMTKEGSRVSARVVPTGQGILIDGAF